MKMKLTTLMFSLLLAVGWTSHVFAQAYVLKADDMKDWTYKWLPNGASDSVTVNYVFPNPKTGKYAAPEVTDPYQIYDLLRAVYMDKRLPGHYYSAYTSTGERENPTYYGGIAGGWNIPFGEVGGGSTTSTYSYDDIVINTNSTYTTTVSNAEIYSIRVYSGNTTITSWDYATNASTFPEGWTVNGTWNISSSYIYTSSSSNTLVFDGSLLSGYSSVTVEVVARDYNYSSSGYRYVYVNGSYEQLNSSNQTLTWTINGTSTTVAVGATTPTDVLITASNRGVDLKSITVSDASTNATITSWTASGNSTSLPSGWYANKSLTASGNYCYFADDDSGVIPAGGTIRIEADKFTGHSSITVTVVARFSSSSLSSGNLYISNSARYWTLNSSDGTYSRTINFPAVVATNTYRPDHEGYTALVVAVKNNTKIHPEPSDYLGACEYTTKDSIIDYISRNIKSVKLLTDGLRIGAGDEIGTVFNCDGTYNKFFFLGKGRARKKSSGVLASIGLSSNPWPSYASEEVPFKYMFEQFSPTGGGEGDQITDFYIEMMDGNVYNIVHDCASVIQNGHQFSMSGNTGTQQYAMSGMNFFIPDYRLKYWRYDSIGVKTKTYQPNDGRDMNPYMVGDDNSKTGAAFNQASYFAVNYANYNPQHAPRVGLYLLTLDAEAFPCEGYNAETNANYTVTLDWTSSLNEMSGGDVPQKYVIYEVTSDENGNEVLDSITTVENVTHYDFGGKKWPQYDYSQYHTYIIMGWPTDSDHPSFIAWSNQDNIVIPGLKDFLALSLDHYESDFDVPLMQNWYRNFLNVQNENDANGLTTDRIHEGYNVFNLMRYENNDSNLTKQVAQIVFENLEDGTVKYTINYVDENGQSTQDIEASKYELAAMGIPTTGILTVSTKGDIVIQPNGYDVNFLSIRVQAGNYDQTWTAQSSTLPNNWTVSSGSRWVKENGAYYLEGNGYILIPGGILGNYTTATVTINAYGDTGKTAKIKVNGDSKAILNGEENAKDYTWTINIGSKAPRKGTTRATKTHNKPDAPTTGTNEAKDNAPGSRVTLKNATNNN